MLLFTALYEVCLQGAATQLAAVCMPSDQRVGAANSGQSSHQVQVRNCVPSVRFLLNHMAVIGHCHNKMFNEFPHFYFLNGVLLSILRPSSWSLFDSSSQSYYSLTNICDVYMFFSHDNVIILAVLLNSDWLHLRGL